MRNAPADATFQMHWLSLPAKYVLRDRSPNEAPIAIRFGDLSDGFDLTAAGTIHVDPCRSDITPAATVTGQRPALVRLIRGAIPAPAATRMGITISGDRAALQRVPPVTPS